MSQPRDATLFEQLTPREREVLDLLRLGLTDREIAAQLEITPQGASYHVSQIIGRLGVRNRHEASTWPERPPWWLRAGSPAVMFWRTLSSTAPRIALAASVSLIVIIVAVFGFIALLLLRSHDNGDKGLSRIVFMRGGDLWVASLDGTTAPPRAITSGAIAAGYAGLARRADGAIDLYYTEQLTQSTPQGNTNVADYALYRAPLAGGEREEVLHFRAGASAGVPITNSSVSPDGRYVAYADVTGLALYDTSTQQTKRLFENGSCQVQTDPISTCYGYYSPRWAPDGRSMLAVEGHWEGGSDIIVDPFSDPPALTQTSGGDSLTARWSPDGGKVCVSESTYATAGAAMVYDVASGQASDSTLQLSLPASTSPGGIRIDARGCAWSANGKLAFGYIVPENYSDVRVAFVDASYAVLSQSPPIPNLIEVVAWLPDGSGVLFNRQAPTTGQPLPPGIYRPKGGVSDLPFPADTVVAVLP